MNTHIPRHKQPLPLLFFGGGDETQVDGSKYNPTVIQFLRDDWVHTQMQQRCVSFSLDGGAGVKRRRGRAALLRRGRPLSVCLCGVPKRPAFFH